MGRKPSPKTPEERSVENARYQKRNAAVGILKIAVYVPAERVPELRAITLNWRAEAKLLTDADYPTADQILQIHAICRTLDLDLPTAALGPPRPRPTGSLPKRAKLAIESSENPKSGRYHSAELPPRSI